MNQQELRFNPCYNGSGVRRCDNEFDLEETINVSILVIMEVG